LAICAGGDHFHHGDFIAAREALRDLRVADLRARCAALQQRIRRLEDAIVSEEAACLREVMRLLRRRGR